MEVDNPFNYSMNKMKAAYLPHPHAFPARYVLHPDLVASDEAQKVKDACEYAAIDLDDKERTATVKVSSVIWATGWEPYDPNKVDYYGFGKNKNVITNVMMERLAADDGPTGGKILRPSDGQPPKHVLFVQCAGSRDENFLPYCSGICCLASLKQATYVREQYPDSKVTICFIDIRTPDRLEDFYTKVQQDEGVTFIKSKVADIAEDAESGTLTVNGEDTLGSQRMQLQADLVVLATGIVPNRAMELVSVDEYGFALDEQPAGHHAAGCMMEPVEVSTTVQEGTGAALRAIQSMVAR
jgi:quinone-modifying oxidoreductase subunit QmoA